MQAMINEGKGAGHVCPYKYSLFLDNWIRKLFQHPKKIVGEYIGIGDTVIDVGCGPGFFSIEMAKMVGDRGRVIAVDLQAEMLAHVGRKARKQGVDHIVEPHRCSADQIGLKCQADFILAFYMVHEAPEPENLLAEIRTMLKTGGRLLAVEPKWHVSRKHFESMIGAGERAGLKAVDFPEGKGGRGVVFEPKLIV
jgi:ubiquinone/menaquinone biosynthesis C-methylase UbiE